MAISDLDYADDSDVALIRRTRSGDPDAYGILHQRHAGSARALAWRMSRSASDADDLVSEGFARVLSALQRGRGPEVAFRPYLLSTIRRLAYDRTNREKREAPVAHDLDEPAAPDGDPVVDGFERDTAAAAFASLPERWRMVLWHTEVEGQNPAEVATLLGIKPNAVAALAYRAREGLRQAYLTQHRTAAPTAGSECRVTNDRLAAYVRGGLTPSQDARVRDHLASCDDCQTAYLELARVNTSLRSLVGAFVLGPAAAGYLAELTAPTAPAVLAAPKAGSGIAGSGAGAAAGRSATRRLAATSRRAKVAAAAAVVVVAALAGAALASRGPDPDVVLEQRAADTLAGSGGDRPVDDGPGGEGRTAAPPERPAVDEPAPLGPLTPGDGPVDREVFDPSAVGRAPAAFPIRERPRADRPSEPPPTTTPATTPPPSTVPPTTTPPTTPSTVPPPTTVAPAPSALGLGLSSAGPLVAGRPGVLVAQTSNTGAGAGRLVRLQLDLTRMTLRGLPQFPARDSRAARTSRAPADWSCAAASSRRLVCTAPRVDAGAPSSFYVPVEVDAGTAPVGAVGAVTGADDAGLPAASPSVSLPVQPAGMAARFATVDHGDVVTVGNALLTCDARQAGCLDARAGLGPVGALNNDAHAMVPVDVDGDATTANSSTATWSLPRGGEVLAAQLYWSGDLRASGAGGTHAPNPGAAGRAVLRSPTGTATPIEADRVDRLEPSGRYQAVTDVTALVRAGGAGAWTLGGAQLATGPATYGGWSLVVAYRDPAAPLRSLVVLDGLTEVSAASTARLDVGGFRVPADCARSAAVDVVAFEGDRGIAGDQLRIDDHALADEANPLGNTFNSSASDRGTPRGGLAPAAANLFGVDVDRFDVGDALAPGATGAVIELSTTQDVYLVGVVAFAVDQ